MPVKNIAISIMIFFRYRGKKNGLEGSKAGYSTHIVGVSFVPGEEGVSDRVQPGGSAGTGEIGDGGFVGTRVD
jgi:hypothetical protein